MMDEPLDATKLNSELVLKPIIEELVRTQVCFPNLKLLVDRLSVVTLPPTEQSARNKAFRLYLSDGEKSIQAVLKRKIHKYISDLDVREGTYIILRTYHLARGKRLNGKGHVMYIVLEDFYPIGEEKREEDEIKYDRYCELIRTPQGQPYKNLEGDYGNTQRQIFGSLGSKGSQGKDASQSDSVVLYDSTPESLRNFNVKEKKTIFKKTFSPFFSSSPSSYQSKKRDAPFEEIDPNLTPRPIKFLKLNQSHTDVKGLEKSPSHTESSYLSANSSPVANLEFSERRRHDESANAAHYTGDKDISLKMDSASKDTRQSTTPTKPKTNSFFSPSKTNSFPSNRLSMNGGQKALVPIKRPLNIRSLDSVTGRHASRNKVYDFFAVVYSVDEAVAKPSMMPLKRDIRVVDPSTEKKVTLSVFVDPHNFKPAVGTIALFRSLTTHGWNGGNLNAYPQQCEGKDWFIVDPVAIAGCNLDGLRDWWKKKSAEMENQL